MVFVTPMAALSLFEWCGYKDMTGNGWMDREIGECVHVCINIYKQLM